MAPGAQPASPWIPVLTGGPLTAALATAGWTDLPLALGLPATPTLWWGSAGAFALGSLAWAAARARANRLPLSVAPTALRQGDWVVTRAILGRGRPVRQPQATATVDGAPVQVLGPGIDRLLGPWTLRIAAPPRGQLVLTVQATEGGTVHTTTSTWDLTSLSEGRFHPLLERHGDHLRTPSRWAEPLAASP